MIQNNMETETLARLYLKQGFPDRAVKIFERLLAEDPKNRSLAESLSESRLALIEKHGRLDENTGKRLRVLEWILARLQGMPVFAETKVITAMKKDSDVSPRERRLAILKTMLERLIQQESV